MVINDDEMKEEMVNDLMVNFGYTEGEALDWVEEHGEYVVNRMWDTYSEYFEENAGYQEE